MEDDSNYLRPQTHLGGSCKMRQMSFSFLHSDSSLKPPRSPPGYSKESRCNTFYFWLYKSTCTILIMVFYSRWCRRVLCLWTAAFDQEVKTLGPLSVNQHCTGTPRIQDRFSFSWAISRRLLFLLVNKHTVTNLDCAKNSAGSYKFISFHL